MSDAVLDQPGAESFKPTKNKKMVAVVVVVVVIVVQALGMSYFGLR